MKKIFEGTGVALVTPFKHNVIDFESIGVLIDKCLREGASAIVALATTGEGTTIAKEERTQIIKYCLAKIDKKAKLIVGTGNNDFKTCYSLTEEARSLGADGALVVTPYYNKTSQRGIIKYYEQLSKIGLPIIMYNVPARTGLNIELDTIKKIIESNPNVYGIKESTCDINRIIKLHQICKDKIAIYSGEDDLNLIFYMLGASGAISVTANARCQDVQHVFELAKAQKYKLALEKQTFLSPINKILFCETNPVPIKYMLKEMGLIKSDNVRMPLVKLSPTSKRKVRDLIKAL